MKTIISLFFALFITSSIYSQEGWYYQSSELSTNRYGAIYALNTDNIFIIADDGIFFKTMDGGDNWIEQDLGISENFYDMYFYNSNFGIAVGQNGTLIKTDNGGDSWVTLSLGINNDLKSVYINNPNNIWVVGNNGIILFSDDLGNNWTINNSITSNNLNSILFRDENVGYIAGDSGLLLSTTNAGNNWETTDFGNYTFLHSLSATNNYTFMLSGNSVFKTNDGINWTSTFIESGYEITDLYFQNDNLGFGIFSDCTTNGDCVIYINKTTNSGVNWIDSLADFNPTGMVGRPKIKFVTNEIGYAISGNNILKTIDGGTFLSINEFENNKKSITFYPNPTNGVSTIKLENSKIQKMEIRNIIGQKVFDKKCNSDNEMINISNLPQGIYFIKIQDDNRDFYNIKVLKQ